MALAYRRPADIVRGQHGHRRNHGRIATRTPKLTPKLVNGAYTFHRYGLGYVTHDDGVALPAWQQSL